LATAATPATEHVLAALADVRGTPLDYIERLLEITVAYCGLPWRVVRSSTLDVPPEIHGQDRILEIARRLGATRYVNASGGRELYDSAAFDNAGIELRFLADYHGPNASILQRILSDDRSELARDIRDSTVTA
jgi:WbqC-like protein